MYTTATFYSRKSQYFIIKIYKKETYTFENIIFFKRFYLFIFRERGKEGEIEGQKYQCVVASPVPLTGDLARKPGMCPDWESNRRPFGSQPMLSPLSYTSQSETYFLS